MTLRTSLTERLGLAVPIIQAPMAGGGDTPELVSAVCEGGGLGSVGAAYLTPAQIEAAADRVRKRTSRAFGINLFAPTPEPPPAEAGPALAAVRPFYAELGLEPPAAPASGGFVLEEQLEAALASGASVFSFTFGIMPPAVIAEARRRGMVVMGTATTVAEAVALQDAGVDAVVVQGAEAGGHRGSFAGPFAAGMVGTLALVPQTAGAVEVPVVASGGIMDGRGLVAALALGAAAVQLGTAFLTTEEAGIPEAYKAAIAAAKEDQTRITRAFSGRPARGIENRFMTTIGAAGPGAILPFPLQNALTRPLRAAAAREGKADYLSLWAGQGLGMARRRRARDLVGEIAREAEDCLASLAAIQHRG